MRRVMTWAAASLGTHNNIFERYPLINHMAIADRRFSGYHA